MKTMITRRGLAATVLVLALAAPAVASTSDPEACPASLQHDVTAVEIALSPVEAGTLQARAIAGDVSAEVERALQEASAEIVMAVERLDGEIECWADILDAAGWTHPGEVTETLRSALHGSHEAVRHVLRDSLRESSRSIGREHLERLRELRSEAREMEREISRELHRGIHQALRHQGIETDPVDGFGLADVLVLATKVPVKVLIAMGTAVATVVGDLVKLA